MVKMREKYGYMLEKNSATPQLLKKLREHGCDTEVVFETTYFIEISIRIRPRQWSVMHAILEPYV